MSPKDELKARLQKASIDPDVFAELVWDRIKEKVVAMLKDMAIRHGTKRETILAAVVNGLCVKWGEDSGQRLAELAERVTEAVMREEDRRK